MKRRKITKEEVPAVLAKHLRWVQKPGFISILCIALIALIVGGCAGVTKDGKTVQRIDAKEARAKVKAGKTLLVCSYADRKCKDILLEGAMLRSTFEGKVSSLPKDLEIIFY